MQMAPLLSYPARALSPFTPNSHTRQAAVVDIKTLPSFPSSGIWQTGSKVLYRARTNNVKYPGIVLKRRDGGRGWLLRLNCGVDKDVDDADVWRIELDTTEGSDVKVAPAVTVQLPVQTKSMVGRSASPMAMSPTVPPPPHVVAASPAIASQPPSAQQQQMLKAAAARGLSPPKRKVITVAAPPQPALSCLVQPAGLSTVTSPPNFTGALSPGVAVNPAIAATVTAAVSGGGGSEPSVLKLSGASFDPDDISVKSQLCSLLRIPSSATVSRLSHFQGGINEGVWSVDCGKDGQPLVLKLVKPDRLHPSRPSEAERFAQLRAEHPAMVHDEALAFPIRLLDCQGPTSQKIFDLIVMHKAPGICLAHSMARGHANGKLQEVHAAFERVGSCIAGIHSRYKKQHGDFTPSNVWFEEATGRVTVIDTSTMGEEGTESDLQRFEASLQKFHAYDAGFKEACMQALRRGYDSHRASAN
mmetsp:Transcript_38890/g.91578  ORF Transcript_38890/g.91578 Transcript_38890/m.91578 type:complete len:472 (+) Transcript_38890:48-1463(+)